MTHELQRWPHQLRAIDAIRSARADGDRVIILTSPTGSGKSLMMCDLIDNALQNNESSVLYTNRKMLTEQTARVMAKHGIQHGVRAAGWDGDESMPVQIASIQTEHARRSRQSVHKADLVLVDEAHLQKSANAQAIFQKHLDDGATVILVTATPIDMGCICGVKPRLIVAARNSELRSCGALVPSMHYGPSEPDTRRVRKQVWEYTESDVRKLIMVQGIFGIVLREWMRLNPEQLPTLLFAPGVAESIWFAEQFRSAGIKAAHIDGKDCWIDGEFHESSREVRQQILDGSESGDIKIICNRFVLREAIDMPWLHHGILATVFSTLQAYLQSGGRLLRAYPGKPHATIQDHGGAWHKHGSLNADRDWDTDYVMSEHVIQGLREDGFRNKAETGEKEPFLCPQCKKVLNQSECPCGFRVTRRTRPVVQADGRIMHYEGDIYLPRKVSMKSDTLTKWERCYYRSKNSKKGMSFNQARGLFFYEEGYWPPSDLPLMPKEKIDWFRSVSDVPKDRLNGYEHAKAEA